MMSYNRRESRAPDSQILDLLEKAFQNVRQAERICDQVIQDNINTWEFDKERDMQHIRTRLQNLSRQADEVRVLVRRCATRDVSLGDSFF